MTGVPPAGQWMLTLYVNGAAASSLHAIENVRRFCDEELGGQVTLEIVDVYQQPARVARDEIFAVPTLVRHFPAPLRRIIGDLSDPGRLRAGLHLGAARAGGARVTS